MVDFGRKLKELRIQAGLSQKQLAERVKVTKSVISYYELQERYPSPEILIKLANIFHVSTDFLLGIEKQQTLDISGLDEEDIRLLQHTISVININNYKNTLLLFAVRAYLFLLYSCFLILKLVSFLVNQQFKSSKSLILSHLFLQRLHCGEYI